jgi:hypothetical protein
MTVRNNRIDADAKYCTGAFFLQATFGFLDNILMEGNLLEGTGFNSRLEYSAGGYGTHIRALNNRFSSLSGAGIVSGGPGWAQWQDNYVNDPSQPDNKGDVVPERKPGARSDVIVAPSNLQATAASDNQINLAWTDNSNNEVGFRIERSTDNVNFTFCDAVSSNVVAFGDSGLTGGTTYYYRVVAFHAYYDVWGILAWSEYSNTANATTAAAP